MPILILMDVTEQVGEYVGEILSDVELQERQSSKDDKKTDNHSIVIYETAARSKKSRGANIFTTDRTNELIFANDWREDVLNPREDKRNDSADDTAPSTKQNLNPVEVVSTEDGRPQFFKVPNSSSIMVQITGLTFVQSSVGWRSSRLLRTRLRKNASSGECSSGVWRS
jgi:hypothetical protein